MNLKSESKNWKKKKYNQLQIQIHFITHSNKFFFIASIYSKLAIENQIMSSAH